MKGNCWVSEKCLSQIRKQTYRHQGGKAVVGGRGDELGD